MKRLTKRFLGYILDRTLAIDDLLSNRRDFVYISQVNCFSKDKIFCLYATFAEGNSLQDDELHILRALNEETNLLIVINSDHYNLEIPDDFSFVVRKNKGRDFGAYRTGIRMAVSNGWIAKGLLLINSSCIWQPARTIKCIRTLSNLETVTSMTDSYRGGYHLQTFFLFIPQRYVKEVANWFAKEAKNWRFKRSTVHFGERMMSKSFGKKGIPIAALFTVTQFTEKAKKMVTTYIDYREELMIKKAPFIKRPFK